MSKPVSDKQMSFLNSLAADKLPNGRADLDAMIAGIPGFMANGGGLASTLIDRLKSLPRAQATTVTPAAPRTEAPEGVHLSGGTYYKVQISKTGGRYAKRLDGRTWTYERGLLRNLSEDTVLTAAQAGEFGLTHGWCIFCSLDLTDERSLTVGYGPVCAKKRGLPWGHVASELVTPPAELPGTELGERFPAEEHSDRHYARQSEATPPPAPRTTARNGFDFDRFDERMGQALAEADAIHQAQTIGLADKLFGADPDDGFDFSL